MSTTSDSAAAQPVPIKPLGEFSSVTAGLVVHDEYNHPGIDRQALARAVDLSQTIGTLDGLTPGCDEHTPHKVLPSEQFIANSVESALEHLGATVNQSIRRSREGYQLATIPKPKLKTGWAAVRAWFAKNSLLILAIVAVGILEYVIGTAWTQRVFRLSDSTAHVVALMLPILFGVVGFAIAHAVMLSAETRVRSVIRWSWVLLVLGLGATVVGAGLVISGTVADDTSSGGGISGGAGGAIDAGSNSTFEFVKFAVYVGLLLTVTVLVMLLHLMDLWRTNLRETAAAAEAARTAPDEAQVAAGNVAFLDAYIDVYNALSESRKDIIKSYVAGVRTTLTPRIADSWDDAKIYTDREDPEWVAELHEEVARLSRGAGIS